MLQPLFYLNSQEQFDTIDYFFIDLACDISLLVSFNLYGSIFSLSFIGPQSSPRPLISMLLKILINLSPFHSKHPPQVISSISTLSIILYTHIPPTFMSPAHSAFLNYNSVCPDACWLSFLGDFTDTTNLTCTNLNS